MNRAVRFLPLVVFALLTAATWQRWYVPFQDTGRDVLTAVRVADGERLYADVVSYYGPLPTLLDAAALRILGRNLSTLLAIRLLFALLGVEALRRLARLMGAPETAAAVGASFVVAACAFHVMGGTWPFPYSVTVLEGSVLLWWGLVLALSGEGWRSALAAALTAGLAAGTKAEILPAAVGGLAVALVLTRPRSQALAGTALALVLGAAAYGIPLLFLGRGAFAEHSFLRALRVPEEWAVLYRILFFAGGDPATFPRRLLLHVVAPTAAVVGAGILAAARFRRSRRAAPLLLFALGCAGTLLPGGAVSGLVPLAWIGAAVFAMKAFRERSLTVPGSAALLAVAVAMLPFVARQPFSLLRIPYSAFSAPLAFLVAFVLLGRATRYSPGLLALFLGLAAGQGLARVRDLHAAPMRWVRFPRGSFLLENHEATLVEETVAAIERLTPPAAPVGVFPEGGLILFLTGRRCPFPNDQFLPGMQNGDDEREMVRALDDGKLAAVVIVNRPLREFGYGLFGQGYLEEFRAEIGRRMELAEKLGKPDRALGAPPFPARADQGGIWLPRAGQAAPAP